MNSIAEPSASKLRSKVGLLVLGLLAVLLATAYLWIRKHGALGQVGSARPRMNPPTLASSAVSPEPLVVGKQEQAFHGVNSCVIGSINGMHFDKTVILERGTVIGLGGWLVDKMNKTVPEQAWIVLAGEGVLGSYQMPITLHEKRPDVSQYFGGVTGYTNSGFIVDIASTALPVGTYHVYIVFDHDGMYYTCDNGRQLKLGKEGLNPVLGFGEKT